MSEIRDKLVAEALSWIGTEYHDHAGLKGYGVDCAYLPLRVYQSQGIIPADFNPPYYSPQQWLHKGEDTAYLDTLLQFAKSEIIEAEVQPGDLVLYKIARSWTHGAIVIKWPTYLLHPIVDMGVIGSHSEEGVLRRRPRRFFSFVE